MISPFERNRDKPGGTTTPPPKPLVGLAAIVAEAARITGQPIAAARMDSLRQAAAQARYAEGPSAALAIMWRAAGCAGTPETLETPTPADLPFAAFISQSGWLIVRKRAANGSWRTTQADGRPLVVASLADARCVSLPRRAKSAAGAANATRWLASAMWSRKGAFVDAAVATALVSLFALGVSLFSMQVYDRVIPSQGVSTLWVLTGGVVLAIVCELLFREIRSRTLDRACSAIDSDLSERFFGRLLGIRMEARPAGVGTLAAQVRGFETVRALLTSASLFVLADVPFSVPLLVVLALVGGSVVVVPAIALPTALIVGFAFQRAVQRQSRISAQASNRKVGLLVEAADGAEAVKANNGEWFLQAQWNRLVEESSASERSVRTFSATAQNLTTAIQQLTYVALVAAGAVLVSNNEMTMGALLACAIIGNRAMAPIVMLPSVMAQWAQARAALDGLQNLLELPNEASDADSALTPESVGGGYRFERIQFSYGNDSETALRVERLDVAVGERVGLIGAVGSGKSTLLKLASGQYRPTQGKVFLGGVNLALLAPQTVREAVAYIPQEVRLFSGTLRSNLVLGLADPGDGAILAAAARTGLNDLIASHPKGLALEVTEGGRGVSFGQKRLIAITRALLARPSIWILDEPTDGMDSVLEARIADLFKELAATPGTTMIVSTHRSALLPLLDRIVVIQQGSIALDGPRDAVLARLAGRPSASSPGAVA